MGTDYYVGVIFGSLMMGALLGLIPGIIGYKKGKKGLAIAGFLCCVGGSFILGLFLSIPMCIIFTVLIVLSSPKSHTQASVSSDSNTHTTTANISQNTKYCTQCGKPLSAGQAFCPNCGARQTPPATPTQCPNCGCKVPAGTIFCEKCGMRIK